MAHPVDIDKEIFKFYDSGKLNSQIIQILNNVGQRSPRTQAKKLFRNSEKRPEKPVDKFDTDNFNTYSGHTLKSQSMIIPTINLKWNNK